MCFEILHLSDLHFGNPNAHLRHSDVVKALDTLLSKIVAPASFLIISGDIIFQGQPHGYAEAIEAIESAIERRKLNRSNILICPGNHDIVKEPSGSLYFTSFDEWSARVRGDKKCTFAGKPARLISNDTGDFLLLNTAYHSDHKMGLVDLITVSRLLEELPAQDVSAPQRLRVAIAHHHMIPVLSGDTSTTQNAYLLIELLEKHGFSALLHGHQHAMLNLQVGQRGMVLSGVGSFGYSTAGYINSVAIYRGRGASIEKQERYGLTRDTRSGIVQILTTD